MKITIISLFTILEKLILHHLQRVSEANIWHPHFELNVLEGDLVSFT